MLKLELDLGKELAYLESMLLESRPNIQKAIDRSLRKTSAWLETHSKRELKRELRVPLHTLSVRFHHKFYLNDGERAIVVWFGIDPISAGALGNSRRNKKGLKVGSHQFDGAFWATMKSGHEEVFRRSKTKNVKRIRPDGQWTTLPINGVKHHIDESSTEIFNRYYKRAQARFSVVLRQQLKFILGQ